MDEPKDTKETSVTKESSMPGLALMGLFLTGILSLGVAMGALFVPDYSAVAFCLIAAAIAFGAIAKVSFR